MEPVHRTELEGAEVCSGRKVQRREAVPGLGGDTQRKIIFLQNAR